MTEELVEKVAKIAHDTFENDDDSGGGAYLRLARAIIPIVRADALEEAAAYVEGKGGVIPGANAFAPLVSGNNQPCMSGDHRDRMMPHLRKRFDTAMTDLATAIRSLAKG